jgi:hypothetical protein
MASKTPDFDLRRLFNKVLTTDCYAEKRKKVPENWDTTTFSAFAQNLLSGPWYVSGCGPARKLPTEELNLAETH